MIAKLTEINMVNMDDDCWSDSGATYHVTPYKDVFHSYSKVRKEKAVFMENSSTSGIFDKGVVKLPLFRQSPYFARCVSHSVT